MCSKEATIAAAIEAVFASINPSAADAQALSAHIARSAHVVAAARPATASALRCVYEGLTGVFDRIRQKETLGEGITLTSEAAHDLKWLLFGPVLGIEGIRLARAEAASSIASTSQTLAAVVEEDVRAAMAEEVSSVVRERLAAAVRRA